MKPLTSKVTAKGQTTIPFEIRKALHLKEGDLLFYEFDSEAVIRFKKLESIDFEWARALESTLTEWHGSADDDL